MTSRAFRDLPPSAPACLPACLPAQVYSLRRDSQFSMIKRTHTDHVSPDIPFYVPTNFDRSHPPNSATYRQVG